MKHPIEQDNSLIDFMANYHRHEVKNLEVIEPYIKQNRSFFLVGNHGFNFVDPALLMHTVYRKYRQVPRVVGQFDIFFRSMTVKSIVQRYGMVPHNDFKKIFKLTKQGKSLLIYPGGVDEAMLRNYKTESYKLFWENRPGLVKLAIKYNIPIVFVAGLGVDEMVFQSNIDLPEFVTSIFKGKGNYLRDKAKHFWNGLIPMPIKVTHVFTEAIELKGSEQDLRSKEFVKKTLAELQQTCQGRLDKLVEERKKTKDDIVDWTAKKIQSFLGNLGL